ncbi:MAG: hypothetical protein JRF63_08155 [Deltaproteobacteria bacterium]|nr:hypothetical protein [Deltaproteobacteria bacterium]
MPWTCQKCGTDNPTNAIKCGKCDAAIPVKPKLSMAWVFGGAVLMFLAYLIGTFLGGVLQSLSYEPSDEEILAAAGELKIEAKTLDKMGPQDQKAAKEKAKVKSKQNASKVVTSILFWIIPLIIFPVAGAIVGFVSEGRTVVEAALASAIGQPIGFVVMRFGYGAEIHWLAVVIGIVVGFFVAGVGAYIGEAVQEKREREAMLMEELSEATFE